MSLSYPPPPNKQDGDRHDAPRCLERSDTIATVWPSGGVTVAKAPRRALGAEHLGRTRRDYCYLPRFGGMNGFRAVLGLVALVAEMGSGSGVGPYLVYGYLKSQRWLRTGRHLSRTGLTAYGRRMLTSAGAVLERRRGLRGVGMLTVTFPCVPDHLRAVVWERLRELRRRFGQKVRRALSSWTDADFLYCLEIHPARSEREGWPVPHLHYLLPVGRNAGGWQNSAQQWVDLWQDTINEVLPEWELDHRPRVGIERVRKSCAGYLAKYVSKGSTGGDWADGDCAQHFPARWWEATQELKREVHRTKVRATGDRLPECLHYLAALYDSGLLRMEDVYIDAPDGPMWVGGRGSFVDAGEKWGFLGWWHSNCRQC